MDNVKNKFSKKLLKYPLIILTLCGLLYLVNSFLLKVSIPKSASLTSMTTTSYQPSSVTPFGEDGVHYINNLYALPNKFLLASSSENFTSFLPSGDYNYSITPLDKLLFEKFTKKNKTISFSDTTLILASEQTMKKMQKHYFHFMEEFLLAWAAHKADARSSVKTIVFPDIENWEGVNETNKQIILSLFPEATLINQKEFEKLSKNYLLHFENAIFVDRMGCHNLDKVRQFNKMAIAHAPLIKHEYLQEFKNKVLMHLKTFDVPGRKRTITYINRKSRRFLEPEFEKEVLSQLHQHFPDCKIQTVWFEKLTFSEQLQVVRNTDILIGAHGNGLTHAYFLPTNSLVLEIFPKGAFAMDYQLVSELSNHSYYALESDLGLISQSGNHMPPRGNVNQVIQPFDANLILKPIKTFLDQFSKEENETIEE